MNPYPLTNEYLQAYADVIVACGIRSGEGVKPGEIVLIRHNQAGAPLVPFLQAVITEAGGHVLFDSYIEYPITESPSAMLARHGTTEQLEFFPLEADHVLFSSVNHMIEIKSPVYRGDSEALVSSTYQKRLRVEAKRSSLIQDYRDSHWGNKTLVYFPTPTLASWSGVTPEQFAKQLVKACFLADDNPVEKNRSAQKRVQETCDWLNSLSIETLHIEGDDVDLKLSLHETARFVASNGGNIPSFECYTTPMAHSVNGWVRFAYPFVFEGDTIEGLEAHFENGSLTSWTASAGASAFETLQSFEGADKIGEIAFTDKRLSHISEPLYGAALWLENLGGTGHMAFGNGYTKPLKGNVPEADRNESDVHKDGVFSGAITVTARTKEGSAVVIYKDGIFTN